MTNFLVPTRRRGNRFGTRQRPVLAPTLARRDCIPTPARGNRFGTRQRPVLALTLARRDCIPTRVGTRKAKSEGLDSKAKSEG